MGSERMGRKRPFLLFARKERVGRKVLYLEIGDASESLYLCNIFAV